MDKKPLPGKDPAFLFFSLDWLQLTASLFPEEKGVLIDLLCHQHRDGSITNDTFRLARIVGLSEEKFNSIWTTVSGFFDDRMNNRLVNLWLEGIMTNRSTNRSTTTHVRSILSRFAVLVRGAKGSPPGIIEQIKKEFNIIDYQHFELTEAIDRLTVWWTYRYNQLVENLVNLNKPPIENENENKDRLEKDVGGMGGEEGERKGFSGDLPAPWKEGDWNNFQIEGSRLPAAMMAIFVAIFPEYPVQEFKDHTACWELAYQIAGHERWKWQSILNGSMDKMLEKWREMVAWARGDPWFKTKALSFWNTNFQGLIQAKNNGSPKGTSTAKGYSGRGPTNGLDPTEIEREGAGQL